MEILTFVVSVVVLGAFVALLTNGIMEGLKQIPAIDKLPAVVKFLIMLILAGGCAWVVQDGAKEFIKTSFVLVWLCSVASAQLGYDKLIKGKLEKLGAADVGIDKVDKPISD